MNASTPDDNIPDEIQPEDAEAPSAASMSAFLPLTLLSISFILVMFWQVRATSKQCDAMTQTIQQNQGPVMESQQFQAGISKLVTDLYEVAKDDNDAKLILYSYDVRDPKTGRPLVTVSNPSGGSAAGPAASGAK